MGTLLDGLAVGDVGAGGVIVIIILMLLFGKLVPKSQLDDLRADKDAQINRLNDTAALNLDTIGKQSEQISKLTNAVDMPTKIMEAIQSVARERSS